MNLSTIIPSAETLVQQCLNGEASAYRALYDRYSKAMYNTALRILNRTDDAEDILQEVWYQFSSLTNLSEIVNVGGWLYRVTANKITDKYRKKKTENLEDFVYEDEDGDFSIKDILLMDESAGPEVKMFQDEIWKKLFEALEELPEKQRLVYVENELNDKTLQEIADEHGENIKTIISRKNYAVKHLRNRLRTLYEDLNS